jgi:hypothetical protein
MEHPCKSFREHLKVAKIDQSPQNKGLSHTSKA